MKKKFLLAILLLSSCNQESYRYTGLSFSSNLRNSSSISMIEDIKLMPLPMNLNEKLEIHSKQEFSFFNSLPNFFRYIDNSEFVLPKFLDENIGGGIEFDENYNPNKGIQTGFFTSYSHLELTLQIGEFFNCKQEVNANEPILKIYALNEEGKIVDFSYVSSITKNSEKVIQFQNVEISYLEIYINNLPYRLEQVYHFQLLGCSLYGYNE